MKALHLVVAAAIVAAHSGHLLAANYSGSLQEIYAKKSGTSTSIRYRNPAGLGPRYYFFTSDNSKNATLTNAFFCKASVSITYSVTTCPTGSPYTGATCGNVSTATAGPC